MGLKAPKRPGGWHQTWG